MNKYSHLHHSIDIKLWNIKINIFFTSNKLTEHQKRTALIEKKKGSENDYDNKWLPRHPNDNNDDNKWLDIRMIIIMIIKGWPTSE